MVRRFVASLALSAAPACFGDPGLGPGNTGASTQPDPSTSDTASSTAAPTTAASTGQTAEPTTTSTTSTTAGTTDATGVAPGCDAPQCQPGQTLPGGPCDVCGQLVQTCRPEDCTWSPAECVVPEACGYWAYEEGVWSEHHPPPSDHAPTAPAAAAFELASAGQIFVLTESTYHVLSAEGAWIASGTLAELFPDLSAPVLQAIATPAEPPSHAIVVITGAQANLYLVTADPLTVEANGQAPCCASWTDMVSPPSLEAVRDVFVDLTNDHGWAEIDVTALCNSDPPPFTPYAAWVTPEAVYVQEGIVCDMMAYAQPYAQFPPFAAPGAPPGDRVGGVTLLGDRLYVFPGE